MKVVFKANVIQRKNGTMVNASVSVKDQMIGVFVTD